MSERAINELRHRLAKQEEVIEHLIVRSELSIQLVAEILTTSVLPLEEVMRRFERFQDISPLVNTEVLEIEKRKLIKSLSK
ncbi:MULTISPECIES: hypothetical protein [unclassified Serratia (in: enterobacteria)]|uniref:hypothetical protein n=1 Tax=unclassified Serratia (in: enterobacteria) TaxID=2647522 RepID=UPI0004687632|nr:MULTISPECIES: hypothetical protein [unclassified Serratia (in: enterobacteria)]